MAWCSTFITKLKKIASKEKQALQAIPFPTVESELKDKQVMKELRFGIFTSLVYTILNENL